MKRIYMFLTICASALILIACSKDNISPEYLDRHPSKAAEISIVSNGTFDDTVTMFRDMKIYKEGDTEGKSWLKAYSKGKMVYDAFSLDLLFDHIDKLNPGDKITPSECCLWFIFSSNTNTAVYEYEGTISLAGKGAGYAIRYFHKVKFNSSFGEYTIDGYLDCPLYEES